MARCGDLSEPSRGPASRLSRRGGRYLLLSASSPSSFLWGEKKRQTVRRRADLASGLGQTVFCILAHALSIVEAVKSGDLAPPHLTAQQQN